MKTDRSKISITGSIAIFIALLITAACGDAIPHRLPSETRSYRDDLGRDISLPTEVKRAISLAPSVTEMIFAAGAGSRLVGVTAYCNYPAEAAQIQKVGDTQTPSIESIVALQPNIVFVSTASQLEAFMQVLNQQSIAVYVMDIKKIDDVPTGLRTLGSVFGTESEAARSAEEIEQRLWAVRGRVNSNGQPSVFVQISKDPLITIGKGSYISDLVLQAGGDLTTKDIFGGYPTLSKETAFSMNPEVIILSDSEDNREPNAVFRNSPAVENGRVYRVDADIISRPGPRLIDALEKLAEIFEGTEGKNNK